MLEVYHLKKLVIRCLLSSDYFVSTTAQFTKLMDNYKVLVFVGSDDGVISSPSVEALLTSIPWSLQSEYKDAKSWYGLTRRRIRSKVSTLVLVSSAELPS
ncbi:serine carboxypeptidase CPVL [Biomphalaria glabrata]|nr:serine carboxypeptidase CPVL [Biomphalaria glabrata]